MLRTKEKRIFEYYNAANWTVYVVNGQVYHSLTKALVQKFPSTNRMYLYRRTKTQEEIVFEWNGTSWIEYKDQN